MPEVIRTGRTNYWSRYSTPKNLIEMEIPPPSAFPEPVAELSERVRRLVGRITIPKDFTKAHRKIARLLKEDKARRQKAIGLPVPVQPGRPSVRLMDSNNGRCHPTCGLRTIG
jgi:hypothetical protein